MKLQGILPVLHLPYHDDFSIDYDTLAREIDWVYDHGVDGVVLAMASEMLRLTDAERDELTKQTVQISGGRGPVITSVGAESTYQAVRHAKAAEAAGAHGMMAIPPGLTACGTDEVMAYYQAIIDATTLPLVIQDASGYVGNSIPLEAQAGMLARNPDRVLFKPEAQPVGPFVSKLRDATDGKAIIFEGLGGLALADTFQRGVDGSMPGSDMPWAIVAMWKALKANDMETVRRIQGPLSSIVSMLHNLDAFLMTEKVLLKEQGIFRNELVRGPVAYEIDAETRRELLALTDALKDACGYSG